MWGHCASKYNSGTVCPWAKADRPRRQSYQADAAHACTGNTLLRYLVHMVLQYWRSYVLSMLLLWKGFICCRFHLIEIFFVCVCTVLRIVLYLLLSVCGSESSHIHIYSGQCIIHTYKLSNSVPWWTCIHLSIHTYIQYIYTVHTHSTYTYIHTCIQYYLLTYPSYPDHIFVI